MIISRELIISLAIKTGAKLDCGTICFNGKDIDDFLMRFAELLILIGSVNNHDYSDYSNI